MCKAKVDQRVFSFEALFGKGFAVLVDQFEGTTDERTANAFAVFGDALAGHALFLVAEVECHSDTSTQEETSSLPAKGTEAVARLCFLYSLVAHCRRLGKCAGGALAEAGRHRLGEALRRRADGTEGTLQSSSR